MVSSLCRDSSDVEERDSRQDTMKSNERHHGRAGAGRDGRLINAVSDPAINNLAYFEVFTIDFDEQ